MDETSGGTMTPPRDEDANSGDFAPVIPLRRRQPDPEAAAPMEKIEPDSRGIWDPDTPIADLPERPSLREQPTATEPLVRPSAAVGEVEVSGGDATTATRHHRTRSRRLTRRRLAQLTVACGFLATAALAVALAGGGRPRATHAATIALDPRPRANGDAHRRQDQAERPYARRRRANGRAPAYSRAPQPQTTGPPRHPHDERAPFAVRRGGACSLAGYASNSADHAAPARPGPGSRARDDQQ